VEPAGGNRGNDTRRCGFKEIAEKYKKSTAQVTLRWELQNGIITIPKSTHQERIKANTNLYDFELTAAEMTAINGLDATPQPLGMGWNPYTIEY